jgi:hypothetical protein
VQRVAGDRRWLPDRYGLRGWVQVAFDRLTYGLVDLLSAARPPVPLRVAAAAAAPRPVLLVAAGTVADEVTAGEWIQRASPESVEVWVVPGAGHTGGLRAAPGDWEQRVVGFLDANLAPRS